MLNFPITYICSYFKNTFKKKQSENHVHVNQWKNKKKIHSKLGFMQTVLHRLGQYSALCMHT